MPRHGDLANAVDDPVRTPAAAAAPSAISPRRVLEIAWGLIVALVLLSAAGGICLRAGHGQRERPQAAALHRTRRLRGPSPHISTV